MGQYTATPCSQYLTILKKLREREKKDTVHPLMVVWLLTNPICMCALDMSWVARKQSVTVSITLKSDSDLSVVSMAMAAEGTVALHWNYPLFFHSHANGWEENGSSNFTKWVIEECGMLLYGLSDPWWLLPVSGESEPMKTLHIRYSS